MNTTQTAETMKAVLEDKKARDVEIISVAGKTTLADYFIVATGGSVPHIRTLADELQLQMKKQHGLEPDHVEGYAGGRWILLDYLDIVVHVFHQEDRDFYSLEKLWESRRP